ncbi:MAG: metal-dependent transcriptional regulator, partial [Chloroflexota bacterium]
MSVLQLSESTEMYLKALVELGNSDVAISRLAERLSVTHVSANEMMRRLVDQGLVTHTPYKGVTLTKEGREAATNVIRRQRLWECFLYDHLNIEWAKVYEFACSLEHATSPE